MVSLQLWNHRACRGFSPYLRITLRCKGVWKAPQLPRQASMIKSKAVTNTKHVHATNMSCFCMKQGSISHTKKWGFILHCGGPQEVAAGLPDPLSTALDWKTRYKPRKKIETFLLVCILHFLYQGKYAACKPRDIQSSHKKINKNVQ